MTKVINLLDYKNKTDSKELKKHRLVELNDPDNNNWLISTCKEATFVIAGRGNEGELHGRDTKVIRILETYGIKLTALDISKKGNPKHPLYLKKDLKPKPFTKFYL